ncbi:hypothetical protein HDU76_012848 [Blyttiomyces sp. JEL0837]|nr:hypothetical protein HDU76_012848 [Blyttiomyces sp. JEL0837]
MSGQPIAATMQMHQQQQPAPLPMINYNQTYSNIQQQQQQQQPQHVIQFQQQQQQQQYQVQTPSASPLVHPPPPINLSSNPAAYMTSPTPSSTFSSPNLQASNNMNTVMMQPGAPLVFQTQSIGQYQGQPQQQQQYDQVQYQQVQQYQQYDPPVNKLMMRHPSLRLGIPHPSPAQSPILSSSSTSTPQTSSTTETPSTIPCPYGPPIQLRPDGKRKRVHASKEQLAMLEAAFQQNPKPNSRGRIEICKRVGINSRSVQIWFQNRRAREKKMTSEGSGGASRSSSSMGTGGGHSSPDANDLFNEAQPTTTINTDPRRRISMPNLTNDNNNNTILELNTIPSEPVQIQVTSLVIGTWRRFSKKQNDLVCILSPLESILRWTVTESGFSFKMEMPFSALVDASIDPIDSKHCSLTIDFNMIPYFAKEVHIATAPNSMDPSSTPAQTTTTTGIFVACDDFTESRQASSVFKHVLTGPSESIERAFAVLTAISQSSHTHASSQLSAQSVPTPINQSARFFVQTPIPQSPFTPSGQPQTPFPVTPYSSSTSQMLPPIPFPQQQQPQQQQQPMTMSMMPMTILSPINTAPPQPYLQQQNSSSSNFRPPFPIITSFQQQQQRHHLDNIDSGSASTATTNQTPFTPFSNNNQKYGNNNMNQSSSSLTPVTLMTLSLSTPSAMLPPVHENQSNGGNTGFWSTAPGQSNNGGGSDGRVDGNGVTTTTASTTGTVNAGVPATGN